PVRVLRRRIERNVRPNEADKEKPGKVVWNGLDKPGRAAADVAILKVLGRKRGVGDPAFEILSPVARFVVPVKPFEQALLVKVTAVRALRNRFFARVSLPLALFGVRKAPLKRARPVPVQAVVPVRLGQIELADASD